MTVNEADGLYPESQPGGHVSPERKWQRKPNIGPDQLLRSLAGQ